MTAVTAAARRPAAPWAGCPGRPDGLGHHDHRAGHRSEASAPPLPAAPAVVVAADLAAGSGPAAGRRLTASTDGDGGDARSWRYPHRFPAPARPARPAGAAGAPAAGHARSGLAGSRCGPRSTPDVGGDGGSRPGFACCCRCYPNEWSPGCTLCYRPAGVCTGPGRSHSKLVVFKPATRISSCRPASASSPRGGRLCRRHRRKDDAIPAGIVDRHVCANHASPLVRCIQHRTTGDQRRDVQRPAHITSGRMISTQRARRSPR